ncbi:hypothetical protein QUF70_11040 [Desulfobacterales bacterium HSG17]|nr:hypothetical protein [Desulfobacterales bacterium HSG17]
MAQIKTFNSYVLEYLGKDLPHELAQEVDLSSLGNETQNFILRMLSLMRKAGQPATDFNPWLIWGLSTVVPNILPGSLGGTIPPLTNPGRHEIFDAYVEKSISVPKNRQGIFVDVGCGFPPVTTVETTHRFPDWKVFGIDRNFAPYLVIDQDGHYACFGRDHTLYYMQPRSDAPDILAFYKDHVSTRKRFKAAFVKLQPMLTATADTKTSSVETGGFKLKQNLIKEYETEQLTFLETELGQCRLPPANVLRCMNLLLYFDPKTRIRMMTQAGSILDQGGILLAGTNHASGPYRRYIVYRKEGRRLHPEEFAFSPDVLRPLSVVAWFTIHEDDPEADLLAELTGSIRSNKAFWQKFFSRVDFLLEQHDICGRGENGFLIGPKAQKSPAEQRKLHCTLWQQIIDEGYVDQAVDALCTAGYDAFKNKVGDIAIRPGAGSHFPPLPLT